MEPAVDVKEGVEKDANARSIPEGYWGNV